MKGAMRVCGSQSLFRMESGCLPRFVSRHRKWRQLLWITSEPKIKRPNRSARGLLEDLVGGPGVKPGFVASDATVLFSYTTHPFGTRAGNPTRISSLGPKRHHALDHASQTQSGRDAEN